VRVEFNDGEVVGLTADNPGPLTLAGTNTWIVGREGAWVIDPGPDQSLHIEQIAAEVAGRGGLAGIALTHGHGDHSDGVERLLASSGRTVTVVGPVPHGEGSPSHGSQHGPLEVHRLPGHTADHVAYIYGGIAFTGDAIFAESSVFVSPGSGSLAGYLQALEQLASRQPIVLAPGHGPVINDPETRINQQIAHRLDRERRLLEALASGSRTVDQLLAEVWDDVPEALLPAAAVTLAAHLDKLDDEASLPEGVERPVVPDWII